MVTVSPADKFIRELKWRVHHDWDNLIICTGERGVGKSSIVLEFNKRYWPGFELDKHIAYWPEEILDIANALPRYGGEVIDEVAEAWGSPDFATKINRTLAKAYTGNRFKNLTYWFCCPVFRDADPALRRMARYLIECKSRHIVVFYDLIQNRFDRSQEPYRWTKFVWNPKPLPKDLYEEYKEIKVEHGEKRLEHYRDDLLIAKGGITFDEVLEQVYKDPAKFCNSLGWIAENLVYTKFKDRGFSLRDAQSIKTEASRRTRALFLNKELFEWQKKKKKK